MNNEESLTAVDVAELLKITKIQCMKWSKEVNYLDTK